MPDKGNCFDVIRYHVDVVGRGKVIKHLVVLEKEVAQFLENGYPPTPIQQLENEF